MIAKEVGNTIDEDGHVHVICGLARCNRVDIDVAREEVKYAKWPRICTDIQLKHKLRKSMEEVNRFPRRWLIMPGVWGVRMWSLAQKMLEGLSAVCSNVENDDFDLTDGRGELVPSAVLFLSPITCTRLSTFQSWEGSKGCGQTYRLSTFQYWESSKRCGQASHFI
ncbi:hypothetical protein NE237_000013 [Protea cynaroides]|uniref:Uncharacterized protein n=1 Tax=Protea cynaroides TaxID=273540 RepID=A0A9Q0GMS8_9MAGN|nr:hypothetical protein NE237_000013 [Protea cynaroides]